MHWQGSVLSRTNARLPASNRVVGDPAPIALVLQIVGWLDRQHLTEILMGQFTAFQIDQPIEAQEAVVGYEINE